MAAHRKRAAAVCGPEAFDERAHRRAVKKHLTSLREALKAHGRIGRATGQRTRASVWLARGIGPRSRSDRSAVDRFARYALVRVGTLRIEKIAWKEFSNSRVRSTAVKISGTRNEVDNGKWG